MSLLARASHIPQVSVYNETGQFLYTRPPGLGRAEVVTKPYASAYSAVVAAATGAVGVLNVTDPCSDRGST